jgi:hypothetical protein
LDNYYQLIGILEELNREKALYRLLTGYYYNHIGKDTKFGVRLSYFLKQGVSFGKEFQERLNDAKEVVIIKKEQPSHKVISAGYGGAKYEHRFRNWLGLQSLMGTELLLNNRDHARKLAVTFRWQVFPVGKSARSHFESSLLRYSNTYNLLNKVERDEFWVDFSHWPNPPQVDWAHMFINLIFGSDWNPADLKRRGATLSLNEINVQILAFDNLEISDGWKPDP